jgi:hypothetical protein
MTKLTAADSPLRSFQTLLSDLATVAQNRILPNSKDPVPFDPSPLPPHSSNAPSICSV